MGISDFIVLVDLICQPIIGWLCDLNNMKSSLGKRIRTLRTSAAFSLKRLAKTLRIDRAHLSRIESGQVIPSEKLLHRLCKTLRGDYEELSVLAGRLPEDIRYIFNSRPKEVCDFVRDQFSSLTDHNGDGNGYLSTGNGNGNGNGHPKYRVIDLFSGAGGFTLGMTKTGRFASVFANDFNDWSVRTYNRNFGPHCVGGDITALLGRKDFEFPKADVVIGGPPCQGFSLLNKKRRGDPRKQLWAAYMEVVKRVEPKAFVMENVPELLNSGEFEAIKDMARKLGFEIAHGILNAADYGVPQRRRRAIIMGVRGRKPSLPAPTHCDPAKMGRNGGLFLNPWEGVRSAIGDLPPPEGTEIRTDRVAPPMDLHFGRTPTAKSIARYKCIPEGGNRFDLQRKRPDITPDCWIRKTNGGTDLFGRLWWNKPAFTIRTEFYKPEKGRYLHPAQNRPITHREAARLQSFPDDFMFEGSKIQAAIQIGNAVPPLLGQRIAEALLVHLDAVHARPEPLSYALT